MSLPDWILHLAYDYAVLYNEASLNPHDHEYSDTCPDCVAFAVDMIQHEQTWEELLPRYTETALILAGMKRESKREDENDVDSAN